MKRNSVIDRLPTGDLSVGVHRKPTQEERNQERLDRLTVAAFELYAEQSFRKTRIEQICSRAGVSTRDFYKLAKTREYLLELVYTRVMDHVENCVETALKSAPEDDFDKRVELAVGAWVHSYTVDPRYTQIGYIETVGVSDEIEDLRRRGHERMASIVQREFSQRPGGGSGPLPGKLPLALIGASNELVVDWLRTDPRPDPSVLTDEILRVYRVIAKGIST